MARPRHSVTLAGVVALLLAGAFLATRTDKATGRHSPRTPHAPTPVATHTAPGVPAPAVDGQVYGSQRFYGGIPKTTTYPNPLLVLTNIGYVVAYDETRKDPAWVCYHLFKVDGLAEPPRPKGFSHDTRTTALVKSADYNASGYDRGHQAPNYAIAVCYGQDAQIETFLMSNILPQRPKLNRDVWEHLEAKEIRDWAQQHGNVWVVTGPVFGEHPDKLASGVFVPEKCFKIVVREEAGQPRLLAFEMPQTVTGTESPGQFLTSVKAIEQDTGFDFFSELPQEVQAKLEAETASGMW